MKHARTSYTCLYHLFRPWSRSSMSCQQVPMPRYRQVHRHVYTYIYIHTHSYGCDIANNRYASGPSKSWATPGLKKKQLPSCEANKVFTNTTLTDSKLEIHLEMVIITNSTNHPTGPVQRCAWQLGRQNCGRTPPRTVLTI